MIRLRGGARLTIRKSRGLSPSAYQLSLPNREHWLFGAVFPADLGGGLAPDQDLQYNLRLKLGGEPSPFGHCGPLVLVDSIILHDDQCPLSGVHYSFIGPRPFSTMASQLFSKVETGEPSGYMCADTITTVHYFTKAGLISL